ncbi:MAG: transposase, partial [Caloramator sp.]|nr:transposase [Caloramator sp.]
MHNNNFIKNLLGFKDVIITKVLNTGNCIEIYLRSDCFKKIKNCNSIQFFICDMWQPYINLAKTYFKNAVIVIDKFHYIRHTM